jgi:hypothetical protein
MSEEQTNILPLTAAYPFGASKGLEGEVNKIKNMIIEWDLSYTSSLRRGYIVDLFVKHGIFDEFKLKHWPAGNTPAGESRVRRFLRVKERYEKWLTQGDAPQTEEENEQEFAAETDLRDFLAKNPNCIEPGLRLYEAGPQTGIEFAVDAGRIDILAVDQSQRFVVIELKVSKGRNKAIGQLLYYMGWVDKHLGKGPCRGMVIAKDIPDDLLLAVQRVPGVSLHRYNLSVSVEPIHTSK